MLSFRCHSLFAWRAFRTALHAEPLASLSILQGSISEAGPDSQLITSFCTAVNHVSILAPSSQAFHVLPPTGQAISTFKHDLAPHSFPLSLASTRSFHTSPHAAAIKNAPTWTTIADSDGTLPTSRPTMPNAPASHSPKQDSKQPSYMLTQPTFNSSEEDPSNAAFSPTDDAEALDLPTPLPSSYLTLPSTYYRLPPEAPTQGTFPQVRCICAFLFVRMKLFRLFFNVGVRDALFLLANVVKQVSFLVLCDCGVF